MPLPFFRALNPISNHSGINYAGPEGHDREMVDASVDECISFAFRHNDSFKSAISSAYSIIVGCHYALNFENLEEERRGSKGILDFLIFPLIARKLMADAFMNPIPSRLMFPMVILIALPFEVARILMGVILTVALLPLICIIHAIKMLTVGAEAEIKLVIPPFELNLPNLINLAPIGDQRNEGLPQNDFQGINENNPNEELMKLFLLENPWLYHYRAWFQQAHQWADRPAPMGEFNFEPAQVDVIQNLMNNPRFLNELEGRNNLNFLLPPGEDLDEADVEADDEIEENAPGWNPDWFDFVDVPRPSNPKDAPVILPDEGENEKRIAHLEHLKIPDDMKCLLSGQIMTHPVRVKNHIAHRFERDWIFLHLQREGTNPVNREPLDYDGIEDDLEIKEKIEQFIIEQLDLYPNPDQGTENLLAPR